MGGNVSFANRRKVAWAMPSWCIETYVVDEGTIRLVTESWQACTAGGSEPFLAAKTLEPTLTPLIFFYNNFYHYLFELVPEVRPMFKRGIQTQGKMLANVIKFIVQNLAEKNHATFVQSLTSLAEVHNARGITHDHYSVMGMVLLHTVRVCMGPSFTDAHKNAWINVYSKMMSVIIPVVVRGDTPGSAQGTNYRQLMKSSPKPVHHSSSSITPGTTGTDKISPLLSASADSKVGGAQISADAFEVAGCPRSDSPGPKPVLSIGTHQGVIGIQTTPPQMQTRITEVLNSHLPDTFNLKNTETVSFQEIGQGQCPMGHSSSKYSRLEKALLIAERLENELPPKERLVGFRRVPQTFVGSEAVNWMLQSGLAESAKEAVSYGSLLIRANVIAAVQNPKAIVFMNDLTIYQLLPASEYEQECSYAQETSAVINNRNNEPIAYAALASPTLVGSILGSYTRDTISPTSSYDEVTPITIDKNRNSTSSCSNTNTNTNTNNNNGNDINNTTIHYARRSHPLQM